MGQVWSSSALSVCVYRGEVCASSTAIRHVAIPHPIVTHAEPVGGVQRERRVRKCPVMSIDVDVTRKPRAETRLSKYHRAVGTICCRKLLCYDLGFT